MSPPVSTSSSGAAQLYVYNSTYALITWQFTKAKNVYAAALWTPGPKNGTVLATVFSSTLQGAPQPMTGTFKAALVRGGACVGLASLALMQHAPDCLMRPDGPTTPRYQHRGSFPSPGGGYPEDGWKVPSSLLFW